MDYPPQQGNGPNNPNTLPQQPPVVSQQPGYPPPPAGPSQPMYPPPPPWGYPGQASFQQGYGPHAGYPPPPAGPSRPMYPPPPGYGPPMGFGAPPYPAQAPQADNMAVAGLILGILSIPAASLGACGLIFGALGLIFSLQGRASLRNHTLASVGVTLSIVSLALSVLSFLSNLPIFMYLILGLFSH